MPETKMGGSYNVSSYVLFDNVFWRAMQGQVNRWRRNTLKLPNTSLEKMQINKVPFLYNFSPSVVPPPIDYSDWIRVTGYWFLDEGQKFTPPKDLADFIAKARADKKKLVYVGFGSIIVPDPAKMTQEVIDAVLAADVRCILSKGWSDRLQKGGPAAIENGPKMPPEIHVIKSCPHDWLFAQMDAAAHHGGSGTTGASLRAGIPTIIRPFFGDQFFFGSRIEDLGVGIWLKKWGATSFGRALWEATHNQRIIDRARLLGERIRKVSSCRRRLWSGEEVRERMRGKTLTAQQENGVETAIQYMYRDMEYAKSLIKRKSQKASPKDEDDDEVAEEAWTFVGRDQPDPEVLTRRLSDLFPGPEQ
jgi:sterol 3beta-glucosyltransferase